MIRDLVCLDRAECPKPYMKRKAKIGTKIHFGDGILTGEVVDVVEEGNRLVQFTYEGIFEEILDRLGQMPLPPLVKYKKSGAGTIL
mgnify:CR=1 FL=1